MREFYLQYSQIEGMVCAQGRYVAIKHIYVPIVDMRLLKNIQFVVTSTVTVNAVVIGWERRINTGPIYVEPRVANYTVYDLDRSIKVIVIK